MSRTLAIHAAARTHPGRNRTQNEDALLESASVGLWAVADGMGGYSRGEWASGRLVDHLRATPPAATAKALVRDVRARIIAAHEEIRVAGLQAGGSGIMGCTVVALMVFGAHYACLWAGDSRLYHRSSAGLRLVTHDHSQVQDMIDAGLLKESEAMAHPQANIITRAVGVAELTLDMKTDELQPGDRLLLCTDGVNKMLSDGEIAACLAEATAEAAADALIARALEQGGRDNVTAVVLDCAEDDDDTVKRATGR